MNRRGFTLLEVLLMVAVLGVLGVITFPKFQAMLYQSREGRTKTHLGDIRGSLAIYYSDNFGLFPSDEGTPESRLASALVPRYLQKIPAVELPHIHARELNTVQDQLDDNGDWVYVTLDGFVGVNCTHLDTKGESISSW